MADKDNGHRKVELRTGGVTANLFDEDHLLYLPLRIGKTDDGALLVDMRGGFDFVVALPGDVLLKITVDTEKITPVTRKAPPKEKVLTPEVLAAAEAVKKEKKKPAAKKAAPTEKPAAVKKKRKKLTKAEIAAMLPKRDGK